VYVGKTVSPSRTKTLSACPSLPTEEYHGIVQPIRARDGSIPASGVQVVQAAHAVDGERTARATLVRALGSASPGGRVVPHEVVDDELVAALEEVDEASPAGRAFEGVVLVDPDHRQRPAALGHRVLGPHGRFLVQNAFAELNV
jgi:hypothetical protein